MSDNYNPPLKLLLVGRPGSGKTRLVSTALDVEELLPIVHIDCEGGYRSFIRPHTEPRGVTEFIQHYSKHAYDVNNINVLTLNKYSDLPIFWENFYSRSNIPKPKTIIIDNLTRLDEFLADSVSGNTLSKPFDVDPIQLHEFNKTYTSLNWFFRAFYSAEINIIATVWPKDSDKEHGSKEQDLLVPMLNGPKMRISALGFFDYVGVCTVAGTRRWKVSFIPDGSTCAKVRGENNKLGEAKLADKEISMLNILTLAGEIVR